MIKPQFSNNEIYHIYNRGVEKRNIFLKEADFKRFLDGIFIFNTFLPVTFNGADRIYKEKENINRQPLVEVISFCLMPNHFHLLLRQKRESGIQLFMQKLCTGYSMYFNKINNRVGSLFQNKFRAVRIATDRHLFYIPHYIHMNPLEIMNINVDKKINAESIVNKLVGYQWSSLSDFVGEYRYPGIESQKFIKEFFKNSASYKIKLKEWITEGGREDVEEVGIDFDPSL